MGQGSLEPQTQACGLEERSFVRIAGLAIPRETAIASIKFLSVTGLLVFIGFNYQSFTGLRGIVDALIVSRVHLTAMALSAVVILLIGTASLKRRAKWIIRIASLLLVLWIAWSMDKWGLNPRPQAAGTAGVPADVDTRSHGTAQIVMPATGWRSWGTVPGNKMRVTANVEPLVRYRTHLHLMLIARVEDHSVDEMTDVRIEKSALFTVTRESTLDMEMSLSQDLLARAFPNQVLRVSLVLLPNPITSHEQISKLSDVSRVGGTILVTNGVAGRIEQHRERRDGPSNHPV